MRRGRVVRWLVGIGLVLLVILAWLFWPWPVLSKPEIMSHANASSYEASVAALSKIVAETPSNIRDDAKTFYLLHGAPTDRVYVLLHGLSNNPRQFAALAKLLYDRGANVIVPRMAYHGEKDRMATDWARLTGQDMINEAAEAVGIAKGLGRHVTVAGLSVNGTAVAWIAQNHGEVDRTVLLAPFYAPAGLPAFTLTPLSRVLLGLPNFFLWWNPALKENLPGPDTAYPRFPTRVIGEVMRLGDEVRRTSQLAAPKSPSILVVTSASDKAGNNPITAQVAEQWKLRGGKVKTYEFPLEEKVPHDFIDPRQPDEQTAIVYPRLIELFEEK